MEKYISAANGLELARGTTLSENQEIIEPAP